MHKHKHTYIHTHIYMYIHCKDAPIQTYILAYTHASMHANYYTYIRNYLHYVTLLYVSETLYVTWHYITLHYITLLAGFPNLA